jgi:adenylate kinase
MDQGGLVPDEVTIGMLLDRIHEEDCRNGYILDGFPRTIRRLRALPGPWTARVRKWITPLTWTFRMKNIINRMSGRRACLQCGATYHVVYNPPKQEGICDVCGSKLVLRDDDKPETVKKRLQVYHEQTQPLIEYYKEAGVLKEVDGTRDMDKVFEDIKAILG